MSDGAPLVLIAEDDPLASMALRAQIDALGYRVAAVARTGTEAADLARTMPVDLAVFDMKMPAMTGIQAATLAFPRSLTPVALLTGFGAADLPDPIPEPPIFAVVTKPVSLDDLRRGIKKANDRFTAWIAEQGRAEDLAAAMEDRRAITRLLESTEEGHTARAAARFLEEAMAAEEDPADRARRLLSSGPAEER